MGRIAFVLDFERAEELQEKTLVIKFDPGGGNLLTANNFGPCGIDAPPLEGDYAVTIRTPGDNEETVIGYADTVNAGIAEGGEFRAFARDADGAPIIAIHLKNDGTLEIGADTDNLVRFSELDNAFELLKTQITANLTAIQAALNGIVPGAYTPVPLTAVLALAKIEEFLCPEWEPPE